MLEKHLLKLRQKLQERGIEALLISHPVNRRYLTGFTGSAGVVLITATEQLLLTDFRYVIQAQEQAPHMTLVQHQGVYHTVGEQCRKLGIKVLSFEQDHLTFAEFLQLKEAVGDIKLQPTSGIVNELRMVKDADELAVMREAARIADQAFSKILSDIKPGVRENEISFKLEFYMRELGATSSSFDMIVASGKRSALPHGVASDKVLELGDLVTLDFGAFYQGYASDITRTVMLGRPSEKQKEIYDIVLEACNRTIAALRPGMTGKEADAVARDYISAHGYGDFFGHSTGHGLGMEVHELPMLSSRGDVVLQPNMVVTVEPGIYLPEVGGVRIEDDVVITETGCEALNQSSKDWIVIE
ncbi:Xaa-Pro aminopeptidase [Laceyella tengchongensis]|uniref:Xaa-Pro aminopeptidase n=1 Tax=Laceyella tengchongensis TaxID=574699 RepID=A0AA45WR20_9BACL|nr:Xaa-Pro peptidase family protein [Laceyella tengchongensis]SMP28574.1 Xaa-Pro aminopeptidase [Laceyella tengchongensis]